MPGSHRDTWGSQGHRHISSRGTAHPAAGPGARAPAGGGVAGTSTGARRGHLGGRTSPRMGAGESAGRGRRRRTGRGAPAGTRPGPGVAAYGGGRPDPPPPAHRQHDPDCDAKEGHTPLPISPFSAPRHVSPPPSPGAHPPSPRHRSPTPERPALREDRRRASRRSRAVAAHCGEAVSWSSPDDRTTHSAADRRRPTRRLAGPAPIGMLAHPIEYDHRDAGALA